MADIDVRHAVWTVLQAADVTPFLKGLELIPPPLCCEIVVKLEQAQSM